MRRKVFVAVDLQNDFLAEAGALHCPSKDLPKEFYEEFNNRKDNIKRFLKQLLDTGEFDFLVITRDWHPNNAKFFSNEPDFCYTWPAHCVEGTWGAEFFYDEIYELLLKYPNKTAIVNKGVTGLKEDYSAVIAGHSIWSYLYNKIQSADEFTEIIVFGVATEYCVYATYKDLKTFFAPLNNKVKVTLNKDLSVPYATEDIKM